MKYETRFRYALSFTWKFLDVAFYRCPSVMDLFSPANACALPKKFQTQVFSVLLPKMINRTKVQLKTIYSLFLWSFKVSIVRPSVTRSEFRNSHC